MKLTQALAHVEAAIEARLKTLVDGAETDVEAVAEDVSKLIDLAESMRAHAAEYSGATPTREGEAPDAPAEAEAATRP